MSAIIVAFDPPRSTQMEVTPELSSAGPGFDRVEPRLSRQGKRLQRDQADHGDPAQLRGGGEGRRHADPGPQMPSPSWTAIADLDHEREYVVMATRFVLGHRRDLPALGRAAQGIWGPLAAADGLLGYGLQADVVRHTLSTLTVWRDREALDAFVHGAAHTAVVQASLPLMADSDFSSWTALGAVLPPPWATAEQHWAA